MYCRLAPHTTSKKHISNIYGLGRGEGTVTLRGTELSYIYAEADTDADSHVEV